MIREKLVDIINNHKWISRLIRPLVFLVNTKKGKEKLEKAIDTYVDKEHKKDPRYIKRLKRKMKWAQYRYEVTYSEYFLMDFEKLNRTGKKSFFGDIERARTIGETGTDETRELFYDKFKTYNKFRKYYRREMIEISDDNDWELFKKYIDSHRDIIIKQYSGSMGKGIQRIKDTKSLESPEGLFKNVISSGKCVVEEFIDQCDELAQFHPSSVNTVRIVSVTVNGKTDLIYPFFRMGRGGSCVDNAGSGGIIAAVDVDTGIIVSRGRNEQGEWFIVHPDSGKQIIGYVIPRWNELLALARELATVVPEQPFVGWDLALTDEGWVVIEGNWMSQFLRQYVDLIGCGETVRNYLKMINA